MDVSINEYRRLVGTGGRRDIRRQYIFDIWRRIAGIVIPVRIRLSCRYLCHHTSTKGENEGVIGAKINIESLTVGHEMINFVRVGLLRKPSLVDTHKVQSDRRTFVISIYWKTYLLVSSTTVASINSVDLSLTMTWQSSPSGDLIFRMAM